MNKVILLSGSPKEDGNCMDVLKECAKVIEENNLKAEIVSIAGMDLKDCMNESYDDGFHEIIEKIKDAKGLIVASPVYWGTARGEVMVALQRIAMASKKEGNFLSRMVGGPIAVARRGGQTSTIQEMLMFYFINDMIVPGSTYWNIVFGKEPGDALKDEEGIKTVKRFSENVAYLIKKMY
ncbi:flavodoxin family protein [Clostridium fallax]|uniref:Multimeric flavodoxin WrbA n=1 Tax=Clostridium fallax TaxID=1533 RepID=A0A1M4Z6I5_9CLOT|nr:flavodoxin family protein [Clostridium fallax]SHF13634.1 Multimeric flavodoxin WrbA [Clostridium fallax]SQB05874.1 flavodoxin [Clostridium fallax]